MKEFVGDKCKSKYIALVHIVHVVIIVPWKEEDPHVPVSDWGPSVFFAGTSRFEEAQGCFVLRRRSKVSHSSESPLGPEHRLQTVSLWSPCKSSMSEKMLPVAACFVCLCKEYLWFLPKLLSGENWKVSV